MHISLSKFFNSGGGGGGREPIVEAIAITENGTYTPSEGIDGFNEVNVNVPIPTFTTEELSATANGEYTPTTDGYSKVTVAVPTPEPNLQVKNIEIVENGTHIISADDGYDGLHNVEVRTNVPLTPQDVIVWQDGMGFNYGVNKYIPFLVDDIVRKIDFSNITRTTYLFQHMACGIENFNAILSKIQCSTVDFRYMFCDAYIRIFNNETIDLNLINAGYNYPWVADCMFKDYGYSDSLEYQPTFRIEGVSLGSCNCMFSSASMNELSINNVNTTELNNLWRAFEQAFILKLTMLNIESTQITSLSQLFSDATIGEMDISNWKLPNLVSIDYFAKSANLPELTFEGWETGIITSAEDAFCYSKLKKLDLTNLKLNLDDSDIRKLFQNSSSLTDLNLSNYDFSAYRPGMNSASYYPFYKCNALTNIVTNENTKFPDINWSASNFNNCPNLTAESMVNLFNALPVSTKGYTFTVGSTNLQKLTDEQKSVAINKGWSLS